MGRVASVGTDNRTTCNVRVLANSVINQGCVSSACNVRVLANAVINQGCVSPACNGTEVQRDDDTTSAMICTHEQFASVGWCNNTK